MATQTFTFSPGTQILTPVQNPHEARMDAGDFAVSTTFIRGQAVGLKTSDNLLYPLNTAATDGTQTFKAFCAMSFKTDAAGLVYPVTGSDSAAPTVYAMPLSTAPIYVAGTFDPQDLQTSAAGTAVAEVDTVTPTSPTTGDIYTVSAANGSEASFTVGATQTAAAVVTGLTNAWNADAYLKALATPSGSSTFILTGVTKGQPLNLTASAVGTGTTALVVTTPATAAQAGEKDTFTPAGSITTGDVYTLTATLPDLSTRAVSFTVGATTTATAVSAGLIAAWNADSIASAIATATGTTTVVLTAANLGNTLSIAGTVVGVGTVSKAVTTAATGRNIADILPGAPGARVLQNGYWRIQ